MKRIVILLTVLIIATGGMAYLYFTEIDAKNRENDRSLHAATYSAAMVFEFCGDRNFYQLINTQSLLNKFLDTNSINELKLLGQYFFEDNAAYAIIKDTKIYCSIIGKTNIELLISTQLANEQQPAELMRALIRQRKATAMGNGLFSLQLADSAKVFIGINAGLMIASSSMELIKERLSGNFIHDAAFEKYINTAGLYTKSGLMGLFVNYNNFPPILKKLVAGNLDGELAKLNGQDAFANLSYNFSKTQLWFNGVTNLNKDNNYYQLFNHLEAQPFTIQNILPAETANYTAFTVDNAEKWLSVLDRYLIAVNKSKTVNATFESLKTNYLVDIRKSFFSYFSNQFITFQLNTGEKLGAVALTNGTKIKQLFLDMSAVYDDEISIFKDEGVPYSLFGEAFSRFTRPYYVVKGNYLIFANNASTIRSFISSYERSDLLINEQYYTDFRNQFPGSGNISFYINLKTNKDIFRKNLNLNYYKQYLAGNGLGEFNSFCYQLSGDNGKFQTSMVISKDKVYTDSLVTSK